jgi:hypothetical protein
MRRSPAFVVLALALGAGCITPTIPIPPPDPTEIMVHVTVTNGVSKASFTYPVQPNYCNGIVYLYDRNAQAGIIHAVNTNCSIGPLELQAAIGDNVDVSVQRPDQTVSTCVVLREGAQDPTQYCQ